MSDSVDRVFAHALQTVRKIPRTGSARPPPEARLQLYGLYKQSMEGDIIGVMPRPSTPPTDGDAAAELEKWDAWHAQAGLGKTEAKRHYITTLIETMHRYASATAEARELVAELEFVWDQIRNNEEGMAVVEEEGEEDLGLVSPNPYGDEVVVPASSAEGAAGAGSGGPRERAWRGRVEKALAKMTTEVAALREQLESRRGDKRRTQARRVWVWFVWCVFVVARHLMIEVVFWGVVFLWMRKRGDRRAEEALKAVGRFVREGLRLGRKSTKIR